MSSLRGENPYDVSLEERQACTRSNQRTMLPETMRLSGAQVTDESFNQQTAPAFWIPGGTYVKAWQRESCEQK